MIGIKTLICVLCVVPFVKSQDECHCNAWGDPHYRTFDGRPYDFMGKCKYTFAETTDKDDECAFSVRTFNTDRGNAAVSWTEGVEISLLDHVFLFKRGKLLFVDGNEIRSKAVSEGENVQVMLSGPWLVLTSVRCGMRVEWNGEENISVKLKKNRFAGKVRGLCGNCDGNVNNDFTDKAGFIANNPNDFANSFVTHDEGANRLECKVEKAPPIPNEPCNGEWERKPRELKYCGAFLAETNGPFTQCIRRGRVNVDSLYRSCRFDVCTNKVNLLRVTEIVCEALSGFALACAEEGFTDINWRAFTGCGLQCGPNQEYKTRIEPCPASCDSKRDSSVCAQGLPSREGCACKAGFVLYGAECVSLDKCPPKKEVTLTFSRTRSSKKEQIHNLDKGFEESFSEEGTFNDSGTPLTMKKSGSKKGHHKEDKSNKEENNEKTEGSFDGSGNFFGDASNFMKSFSFNRR